MHTSLTLEIAAASVSSLQLYTLSQKTLSGYVGKTPPIHLYNVGTDQLASPLVAESTAVDFVKAPNRSRRCGMLARFPQFPRCSVSP